MAIKNVKTTLPSFCEEVKILKINAAKVPTGTYFTAKVNGKLIEGLIFNNKANRNIYFCQNFVEGTYSDNKLGYRCSYGVSYSDSQASLNIRFKEIKFPTQPKTFTPPVILPAIAGYIPRIEKGKVIFGCKTVTNEVIRKLAANLKD